MRWAAPFLLFFIIAIVVTVIHFLYQKKRSCFRFIELHLSYLLLIYVSLSSFLNAYSNIFMGPQTAALIGWPSNPFFQFEIGIANFSFGVLGLVAYWVRGRFWEATLLGWAIFLCGAALGHIIRYISLADASPLNFGAFVWFSDIFMPLFSIALLIYVRKKRR